MPSKDTYIGWILPLLGLVEVVIYFSVLHYFYHLSFEHALIDSAISTTLLALVAWGAISLIRLYPTKVGIVLYSIFVASVFSLLAVYINQLLLEILTNNHSEYHKFLTASMPVRYGFVWLVCGWISTYIALQKKINEQNKKFQHHTNASTLLREAELYKLRQQLQPHFLYNSLNSINALVMTEPDKAQEMTGLLSDFLRGSVSRDARERIPIDEELTYIESYLAIESVRFGDRLSIEIQKTGETPGMFIPPFLLQPILENAIKFGIYGKSGEVIITIDIMMEPSLLTISITNPYDPQNQPPRGTGFGLRGINRRLYLIYGRADLLSTVKEENIYTTTLKIPQGDA